MLFDLNWKSSYLVVFQLSKELSIKSYTNSFTCITIGLPFLASSVTSLRTSTFWNLWSNESTCFFSIKFKLSIKSLSYITWAWWNAGPSGIRIYGMHQSRTLPALWCITWSFWKEQSRMKCRRDWIQRWRLSRYEKWIRLNGSWCLRCFDL